MTIESRSHRGQLENRIFMGIRRCCVHDGIFRVMYICIVYISTLSNFPQTHKNRQSSDNPNRGSLKALVRIVDILHLFQNVSKLIDIVTLFLSIGISVYSEQYYCILFSLLLSIVTILYSFSIFFNSVYGFSIYCIVYIKIYCNSLYIYLSILS